MKHSEKKTSLFQEIKNIFPAMFFFACFFSLPLLTFCQIVFFISSPSLTFLEICQMFSLFGRPHYLFQK